jgi:hypothetical protein
MKIKTNLRAGFPFPPPVSRCVGIGGGPIPNPYPIPEQVV